MTNAHENPRQTLYRSRHGAVFGVCRGLADYLGVSRFWMRIGMLMMMLFSGLWPGILIYVIAALLMKPEPVIPLESDEESEFYNSFSSSRNMALQRLKRAFDSLDRRIQRMEDMVTSREYMWEKRFKD
jgi:phage shock protein C